jgi:cation:H+ antiporter
MNTILFFIFAITTVILSIKMSKNIDKISKKNLKKGYIISGILLASVTSLPELVTSITAVKMNNPYLAIGDIIGSNTFNIFMMCLFDIFFFKKMFFNRTKKYILEYLILIIINISIILFLKLSINFSLPTILIFVFYIIYIYNLSKPKDIRDIGGEKTSNKEIINIFVISLLLFFSSILLTATVDKISLMYPKISSSIFGAILLGITTSLPEVITFITLIKLDNYNMAIVDILGSNIFNFFILGINDILTRTPIYLFADKSSFLLINISILITMINFYQNINKKKNKLIYFIPSIIVIVLYIIFIIKGFNK